MYWNWGIFNPVRNRKDIGMIKKGCKYGKLTALEFAYRGKDSKQYWRFKCDCGKEAEQEILDGVFLLIGRWKNEKTVNNGSLFLCL